MPGLVAASQPGPCGGASGGGGGPDSAGCQLGGVDWAQVLEGLATSGEWVQLRADLEGTPGGGALVAALAQRALRCTAEQARLGHLPPHSAAQPMSAGALQPEARVLVVAVQQAAWEKLHCGSWHEVGVVWRDAYTLACVLAAAAALLWPASDAGGGSSAASSAADVQQERQRHQAAAAGGAGGEAAALRAALRELDMAAIMGGPLFRPAVDHVIDALQSRWQRLALAAQHAQRAQQPASGGPAQEPQLQQQQGGQLQQHVEVPLPPGSLGPRGTPIPLEELPSLETFWREYMARGGGPIPVLIDGAMENWPALQKWRDVQYLRSVAGPRTVPVEVGEHYLADQWGQRLMTLQDFIDTHILGAGSGTAAAPGGPSPGTSGPGSGQQAASGAAAAGGGGTTEAEQTLLPPQQAQQQQQQQHDGQEGARACATSAPAAPAALGPGARAAHAVPAAAAARGYLAQHPLFEQIPALAADIREPDYCVLGEGELQSVCAWFGPAGTVTPLHTDPHHNLLCQVVGRKYLRLYTPDDTAAMYPFSEGLTTNSSQVDLDAPDDARFPRFAPTPFRDCVLAPGQMLYIPPGWWHYVKALDTSFSVSFWWK